MKKQIQILAMLLIGVIGAMFVYNKKIKKSSGIITIYVHGTLFNLRNVFSKIEAAKDLTYVPDGLTLVKDLSRNAVAYKMAKVFSKKDPRRFQFDSFYAFGWSGKLSFDERQKSAEHLVQETIKISQNYYEQHGIKPIIKIVTFSHGGNVALNMAQFLPKDFFVELILIACPIQPDTEPFALSDCFSKIYTIYSLSDVLQVIDPINVYRNIKRDSSKKLLSTRFLNHESDKIKQACVSVNGKYLGHLELFQLFNKHIPAVLNRVDALPETVGAAVHYMNIQDAHFPSFNGVNVMKVLQGKDFSYQNDFDDTEVN